MSEPDEALDSYLLGEIVQHPKRSFVLAIATGMAVAYELSRTPQHKDVLHALNMDHVVCERACEAILHYWAERKRAGDVSEQDFQRLLTNVIKIARAS